MKLNLITENETPQVAYRQLGDGSWAARITDKADNVLGVHVNKDRQRLVKVVNDRYFNRHYSTVQPHQPPISPV